MKSSSQVDSILLTTIEFPKNLVNLTERLPESQYSTSHTVKKNCSDQKKKAKAFPNLMMSERMTSSNTKEPPTKIQSPEESTYIILPGLNKNLSINRKMKQKLKLSRNEQSKGKIFNCHGASIYQLWKTELSQFY